MAEKSFNFTVRIVKVYRYLCTEKKEYVLSKQLESSGTAIGALISEGVFAESKVDFVHKYGIAPKECNETILMITASIITAKKSIKENKKKDKGE